MEPIEGFGLMVNPETLNDSQAENKESQIDLDN